jgi:hypothetical protein
VLQIVKRVLIKMTKMLIQESVLLVTQDVLLVQDQQMMNVLNVLFLVDNNIIYYFQVLPIQLRVLLLVQVKMSIQIQ